MDLGSKNTHKLVIAAIVWLILACVPIFVTDPFYMHLLNLILQGICLCYGWNILARAGYISFGHNAFLGIGAYVSAYVTMHGHVSFGAGFLGAGIVAAIFSFVLGAIILRFRGVIFVLSTFAFASIMLRVFRLAVSITGGVNGVTEIPPPVLPFVGPLHTQGQYYVLFFIYFTLLLVFTMRLFESGFGKQLKAIGENMFLAEATGIDTFRSKLIAFVISAALTGFSGSLFAHYQLFIADTSFEINKSLEIVIWTVVGGWGTLVGPIIGTAIMVPLPELLRGFVAYQVALYGLILIVVLRFFEKGIWGTIAEVIRRRQAKRVPGLLEQMRLYNAPERWVAYDPKISNKGEGAYLVCNGLRKNFGGLLAVNDVSFSVQRGDILGIIGPNGSGKSTIYNMITGMIPADGGTIYFDGRDITRLKPSRINQLGIARVFQSSILYSQSTVRENVARALIGHAELALAKDLFGLETEKHERVAQKTSEMLELCGLSSVSGEFAGSLPHGFQRMLSLAMALVAKPKLLLLDEPVTGMSAEELAVMASTLEQLHNNGFTMVVVEHNVNFIMRLCHRIVVLNYGQKIAEGTPQEVRNNPEVIRSFLGG